MKKNLHENTSLALTEVSTRLLLLVLMFFSGYVIVFNRVGVLCMLKHKKVFVNICVQIDHSTGKLANEWNLTDIKFAFIYTPKYYMAGMMSLFSSMFFFLLSRNIKSIPSTLRANLIITQFYGQGFLSILLVVNSITSHLFGR